MQHPFRTMGLVMMFVATALGQSQRNPTSSAESDIQGARGTVLSHITCRDNPGQSYALYLPSWYSPDRLWPVLYAFDPFARGQTAVEVYKEAAEQYGYIVVGSNNARNGPTAPQLEAMQAVWLDTHRRLAIDKKRVYATGLSGGARMATSFALYCYTCEVAGVIAQGAGYPVMSVPAKPAHEHFVYYAIVGDADLNYPEIVALRKKKDATGEPCKVKIYPGPHQWAPPEVVEGALEWLELKAMQAGTEKVDAAFVRKVFANTQAEADQAEQRHDALSQYYALRSLVEDFRGLEDTAPFSAKLALVKNSKAFKIAERNEEREIQEQASLTATTGGELAQFGAADPGMQTSLGQHVVSNISDLRRRANGSGRDHLVYARALSQLEIQGMEAGEDALRERRFAQAIAYFQLMAEAEPNRAWPLLGLAEARVRAGDRKAAIQALEQAVRRGLKDPQALTQDPELQPLSTDPNFQRIVESLRAH